MNSPAAILNFAYGSNMLSRRIQERVPSARAKGFGVLRGYELRWHKSGGDGSGKCDIVQAARPDAVVFGVVYEIAAVEKYRLDQAEGLGAGYDEIQVQLETESGNLTARAYQATRTDDSLLPFTWYRALVVAGATEHALPPRYIASLDAVAAADDLNIERAQKNFALTTKDPVDE